MYVPEIFRLTDTDIIERYIRENGFATLLSSGSAYPLATHIPLELELNEAGEKILSGHMAKANPQWQLFAENPKVTAVFLSDINHYISSSWYDHPNAPTWNYISVHVSGTVQIVEGQKRWDSVKRLTERYERESKNPVSLDTLPPSVQQEINGLVAFEITIDKVEAAFKLSQNRNERNYQLVLDELNALGTKKATLLADIMKQFRMEHPAQGD